MTALLLQPLSVRTSKGITNTCATITIGVPQGESPSCTLFKNFQDTLLEKLSRVPHHISDKVASAQADDVILTSKTAGGLQLLLENCTEWSAEYQMACMATDVLWCRTHCEVESFCTVRVLCHAAPSAFMTYHHDVKPQPRTVNESLLDTSAPRDAPLNGFNLVMYNCTINQLF